jgi:hypothetical protein
MRRMMRADPPGPFPAGRALPAGFVSEERHGRIEGFDHAGGLIHDDHAPEAGHASRGHEGVEIHGRVDLLAAQNLRGKMAPGMTALRRLPLRIPPARSISCRSVTLTGSS